MFYSLTSNGSRVGDNVASEREPSNLFNPSYVKFGLSRNNCVYDFGHLKAKIASIIHPLGTWLDKPGQVQCIFAYYTIIT